MIANARASGTETAPQMNAPRGQSVMKKVAIRRCVVLILLVVSCMVRQRINAQTVPDSSANAGSSTNSSSAGVLDPTATDDSMDWLFPIMKLNRSLPSWLRIGGEYRGRIEGPTGIGFTGAQDFYYLDRL